MTELRCGKCGAFLARIIELDGKFYLDAGTRLEYATHLVRQVTASRLLSA